MFSNGTGVPFVRLGSIPSTHSLSLPPPYCRIFFHSTRSISHINNMHTFNVHLPNRLLFYWNSLTRSAILSIPPTINFVRIVCIMYVIAPKTTNFNSTIYAGVCYFATLVALINVRECVRMGVFLCTFRFWRERGRGREREEENKLVNSMKRRQHHKYDSGEKEFSCECKKKHQQHGFFTTHIIN